jgi:hypothetical protein
LPIFLDFEESFSFRIGKRMNLLEPAKVTPIGPDSSSILFYRPRTCLEATIRDAIMQALSFL